MLLLWIIIPICVLVVAVALVPVLSAMVRDERHRRSWRLRRGRDNSFERALRQEDPKP